ncbi:MAG: hypothetical protein GKS00_11430 [Alphaproteobacteria bacterium]|nr:hypothetical protein [Alphaproteobacteria bacterium]
MSDTNASPKKIEIPEDELYRLRLEDMLRELEEKLASRLKHRFTFVIASVAVLSFFGIQGLASVFINEQLDPQIDKARSAAAKLDAEASVVARQSGEALTLAKQAHDEAKRALELVKTQGTNVQNLLNELKNKADHFDTRFSKFDIQFKNIRSLSENVRSQLEVTNTSLKVRITELSKAVPETTSQIANLENESKNKLSEFKQNSQYLVDINYDSTRKTESLLVTEFLRELGYRVDAQ